MMNVIDVINELDFVSLRETKDPHEAEGMRVFVEGADGVLRPVRSMRAQTDGDGAYVVISSKEDR